MLWWATLGLISLLYSLKRSESIPWPAGTYGIPKPASGCPWADGFQWPEGWVSQDTDDNYWKELTSKEFHLDGEVDYTKVQRSFCIKTDITDDTGRPEWPPGKYCIYKKGGQCPTGLKSGYVYWDDDDYPNSNKKHGTLPDGEYGANTKIWFCCRTDGDKNVPIVLPSKTPLFLLAYESAKCQMVKWAIASLEWIYYDTEDIINRDTAVGAYPYEAGKKHPTIYYCYYRGSNETLTAANGTFQSPNYPRNYPDGQYCSWRITVSPSQQIHLTFTNFSLQSDNDTDGLFVYDGENSTAEVLGYFYGGHLPPREGLYSSSNHMFLIFKSDGYGSYTGFRASYNAVNHSATTVATTAIHTLELTSLSPVTPKTLHTLEKTTSSEESTDGSSNEGWKKNQRKQHKEKGLNVVAVVVPVVALVFLVALLVAGLFYCKRRRTKKEEQGVQKEVVYSRSNGETPMLLENPYYDRSNGETPMSLENPYYVRGMVIENRGCPSEADELYTEAKEPENKNKKDLYMKQENENPLYQTAAGDTVFNPIHDRSNSLTVHKACSSEESELYTEVYEENTIQTEKYMQQEDENPLYETAEGDAVFNPVYDSSI